MFNFAIYLSIIERKIWWSNRDLHEDMQTFPRYARITNSNARNHRAHGLFWNTTNNCL